MTLNKISAVMIRPFANVACDAPWHKAQQVMSHLNKLGFVNDLEEDLGTDDEEEGHEFSQTLTVGDEGFAKSYFGKSRNGRVAAAGIIWHAAQTYSVREVQFALETTASDLTQIFGVPNLSLEQVKMWAEYGCHEEIIGSFCWSRAAHMHRGAVTTKEQYMAEIKKMKSRYTVSVLGKRLKQGTECELFAILRA